MGLLDLYNKSVFQVPGMQPQIVDNSYKLTERQKAYNELLNKQDEIAKQNEQYNTYNNLMSGMGGLGKVLASAFVKNPIEKAGAMNGLTEQEYRTDDLRKAYEQARANQNKDYVQQAKDQLALAIADEDKALANDWKEKEFDYRKAYDELKNNQWNKSFDLNKNVTEAQINKINADIDALNNKPEQTEEEKIKLEILKENLAKAQRENDPEYIKKQEEKEQYEKDLSEANKLIEKKLVNASDGAFLLRHPEAYREIIQRYPFSPFRGKYEVPSDLIKKYEQKEKNAMGDTYGIFE